MKVGHHRWHRSELDAERARVAELGEALARSEEAMKASEKAREALEVSMEGPVVWAVLMYSKGESIRLVN